MVRVVTVTDNLVAEAAAALGVQYRSDLRPGAQKRVCLVDRGGQTCVMKVIAVGSSRPDALRRAQREVELLGSIDSPNVVKVESALVELGTPVEGAGWLEEFIEGDDLAGLLGSTWSWTDVATMGLEIALGLGAMHRQHVVHRDLSPNNVRRSAAGPYKVLDPGFARHTLRSGLTIGGQPGTAGYLSPEHLFTYSGAPTSPSDVFAVGILMYQALTAQQPIPYLGDDGDYLRRLSRVEIVEDIGFARPDLGADEAALIRRCLHPQPARRFLNGDRLAQALEGLL